MPTLALTSNAHKDSIMGFFTQHADPKTITCKPAGEDNNLSLISGSTNDPMSTVQLRLALEEYASQHKGDGEEIKLTFL
jgi:hypothetical protein